MILDVLKQQSWIEIDNFDKSALDQGDTSCLIT